MSHEADIAQEFPRCEVILFGSYVTGHAQEYSDIDVAIVAPELTADFLTLAAHLCYLRNDIDSMIEPYLMLESGNNSGLLQEVQWTGEVIYRAA